MRSRAGDLERGLRSGVRSGWPAGQNERCFVVSESRKIPDQRSGDANAYEANQAQHNAAAVFDDGVYTWVLWKISNVKVAATGLQRDCVP